MKITAALSTVHKRNRLIWLGSMLVPFLLFWLILVSKIPYSFSQYFHNSALELFLIVLFLYYLCFRFSGRYVDVACLGLTMVLFALSLSYMWTSGYSDNKVIAGFLPYKDGAGYYSGATLILNGLPLERTLQASWRPLFPGFLSSLLLFTAGNLKWALAVLVLLAAVSAYFSSRQVFAYWGALPASLFITFLYFYIQPLIGLTMTELLGFAMGCLAFSMLWQTAYTPRLSDLILGLSILVLALSVRAGTFFMLPFLVLWAGITFREGGRFSYKSSALALGTVVLVYFLVNSAYVRLMGVPDGKVFGNFAYSLYGQVRGGMGWHYSIEELGTRETSIIYKEAYKFFLDHPFSLLIGIAKSYRDFLIPSRGGIFTFDFTHQGWANVPALGMALLLTIRGLIGLLKDWSTRINVLLLSAFIGFILSIPFLPPIDGGPRFYASTVPFFFILPALGAVRRSTDQSVSVEFPHSIPVFFRAGSIVLFILTVVVPMITVRLSPTPSFVMPDCSSDESPFVIKYGSGSYVDLISHQTSCGLSPATCFSDFEKNGAEKTVDDFYQQIDSFAKENQADTRIIPAINLVDQRLYYFSVSHDKAPSGLPLGTLSGCASEIKTKNQSIYQVESILSVEGN